MGSSRKMLLHFNVQVPHPLSSTQVLITQKSEEINFFFPFFLIKKEMSKLPG